MLLLDLSTALLASRVTLLHVVAQLQAAGHEVSVWSALDRKCSREALIAAGVLEIFDDLYHMDGLMKMESFEPLHTAEWITIDQLRQPAVLLRRHGIGKLPLWLGWVG